MKKNLLATDYDVFIDDVIKLFMNKYNDIDKQMEWHKFSFKFVGSLSTTCKKVNEPIDSSYIEIPKWLR